MSTFTTLAKNASTLATKLASGLGWYYNQPTIKYNGPTETGTGLTVYYNSLGTAVTMSTTAKHSATFTTLIKH